MDNPWLNIPASDYEGHMRLPEVNQLSFLGDMLKESLNKYDSRSFAYLGCSTGNGLEYIRNDKTHNVTAIDINPEYLSILRNRYQRKIPNLEIIETDLNSYQGNEQRYSLIFAGLLFEYLAPGPLLKKISTWLENAGVMVVVLQLQDKHLKKVSDTPYSSLKLLDPVMNLISDQNFKLMAKESGMKEFEGKSLTLESGKSFYVGVYGKTT
jgi:SAM-dependent methyltransferase